MLTGLRRPAHEIGGPERLEFGGARTEWVDPPMIILFNTFIFIQGRIWQWK